MTAPSDNAARLASHKRSLDDMLSRFNTGASPVPIISGNVPFNAPSGSAVLRSLAESGQSNSAELNLMCIQAALEDFKKAKTVADELQQAFAKRKELSGVIERLNAEVEEAYRVEQELNSHVRTLEQTLEDDGRRCIRLIKEKDAEIRAQQAVVQDERKRYEDRVFELESSLQLHRLNVGAVQRKIKQFQDELDIENAIHQCQDEKIVQLQEIAVANKSDQQAVAEGIAALEDARTTELECARAADAQLAALEQQRTHDEGVLRERLAQSEAFARSLELSRNEEYMTNALRDQEIAAMLGHTKDQTNLMAAQSGDAQELIEQLNNLLSRQEGMSKAIAQERDSERSATERERWIAAARQKLSETKLQSLSAMAGLADIHLNDQAHTVRSFRRSPSRTNDVVSSMPSLLVSERPGLRANLPASHHHQHIESYGQGASSGLNSSALRATAMSPAYTPIAKRAEGA